MAGKMTKNDLTGLQSAITIFSNSVSEFDGQYTAMRQQIQDIGLKWTGVAYKSFEGALETWLADFGKVLKVLNEMENALAENHSLLSSSNETAIRHAQDAARKMVTPPLQGFKS
jgi:WXG100 family type VII secretion target